MTMMPEASISTDVCTAATVRRIAAMLDLDSDMVIDGSPLPRGWHFVLLGGATRRSALRADGFPGFGVPMPDFGLPRLLFAGRRVEYRSDLVIGSPIHRLSALTNVTRKQTASGEMAVVTIHHELASENDAPPAVVEEQTYILLGPAKARIEAERPAATIAAEHAKRLIPDETLLFQFSALGFNSHKIHIDRAYARDIEGLPDLVVNGGLATLLLTEFLRVELGVSPARMTTKHIAPLYCGRPLTLAASRSESGWHLRVHDDAGQIAVDAEVLIA
jgi:3-methylfumaryl-CoA hydratase